MTIFYASDDAIDALAHGFLARTAPKEAWTHAAHFATTLWLIARRADIVPERDMPSLIRAFNASLGGVNDDHNGYHETITQASIRMARRFRRDRPPEEPLHDAVDALMAGELGDSAWPLTYWAQPTLFSVAARRAWCEPDLLPLPD